MVVFTEKCRILLFLEQRIVLEKFFAVVAARWSHRLMIRALDVCMHHA